MTPYPQIRTGRTTLLLSIKRFLAFGPSGPTRKRTTPLDNCERCEFAGWTGTQYYTCRRGAPTTDPDRTHMRLGGIYSAVWPHVEARDWCGEFRLNETPPAQRPRRA